MPIDNSVNTGAQMGMAPNRGPVNGGYMSASEMPEVQNPGAPAPGMEKASHPMIAALQTIQTGVAAMEKEGDPKADAIKSGLMQILQALTGQGGEEGAPPPPGMAPEEAPPENGAQGMGMDVNSNNQAVQLV